MLDNTRNEQKDLSKLLSNLGDYIDYGIEVIGNKFDNPDLLEKEGE